MGHSVSVSRPKAGSPVNSLLSFPSPHPETSSIGLRFSSLQSIGVPTSLPGQLWALSMFSYRKGVNTEAQEKDEAGPRVAVLLCILPLCSKAAVAPGCSPSSVPELLVSTSATLA